jgi:hypothetical protein
MRHNIPYIVPKLIIHEKLVYADGIIVEIKAWDIPKSKLRPEGYKYSFVYIDPRGTRVLGYDNSKQQGHHKHAHGKQFSVEFSSIDDLIEQFLDEVRDLRGNKT